MLRVTDVEIAGDHMGVTCHKVYERLGGYFKSSDRVLMWIPSRDYAILVTTQQVADITHDVELATLWVMWVFSLIHYGLVTNSWHHRSSWVKIGSGIGFSPLQCQTITWTSVDLLLIGPLIMHFNEIWIKIQKNIYILSKCTWKCCLQNGSYFAEAWLCR